ncbi:hypothetical protein ACVIGB_000863 [Bradyrhizobium sp. USDA 4341]
MIPKQCSACYRKANVVTAVYADISHDPAGTRVQRFLDLQFRRARLPSAIDPRSVARLRSGPAFQGTIAFRDAQWHLFDSDVRVRDYLSVSEMRDRFFPVGDDPFRYGAFQSDEIEVVAGSAKIEWRSFLADRARTDRLGSVLAFGSDPLFVQAIELTYSASPQAAAHLVHLKQACRYLRKRLDLDDAARIDLTLCEEIIGSTPKYADGTTAMAAFTDGASALAGIAAHGGVIWEVVSAGIPLSCFLDPTNPDERDTFLAVRETVQMELRQAVVAPPAVARFSANSTVGARAWALLHRLPPSPDLFVTEPSDLARSSFRRLADGIIGAFSEADDTILLAAWPVPRFSIAALAPMSEVVIRAPSAGAVLIASEQGCLS